jgi:hypothetical protein
MGDFNARVGTITRTAPFSGNTRDNFNGAMLREFCTVNKFKIADTFFEEEHGDYGTWRRSSGQGFNAALDHILVQESIWHKVRQYGVRDPDDELPDTDHRVVYLDITGPQLASPNEGPNRKKQPKERLPLTQEQERRNECTRMNKRILEIARSKDGNEENKRLEIFIDSAVCRKWAALKLRLPTTNPHQKIQELAATVDDSLDEARTMMWSLGVPSQKSYRPGSYMHADPLTKKLLAINTRLECSSRRC